MDDGPPANARASYRQNSSGEHTLVPLLSSGAQHPLLHWEWALHTSAHDVPVTVELTQTEPAQHVADEQLSPAVAHDGAHASAAPQMAVVPSTSGTQHPLAHWSSRRHDSWQKCSEPLTDRSRTHAEPLQHAFWSASQLPPGATQAAG